MICLFFLYGNKRLSILQWLSGERTFFVSAPASVLCTILCKEWLYILSTEVCKVTNTQAPSQIFVHYSQETHNPKVLSEGSCGSNKYPWSLWRLHRSLVWGGERLSFLFLNTPLIGPDISQQGAMGCVQAAAARTINDDHILKHAYSRFPTI